MERYKCKLCTKSFSNGRALGGHMRSHLMNLPLPTKPEEEEDRESALMSSSSEEEEEEKGVFYGLRLKRKRSVRFVDPEISFAVDTGSVVLQDRESETESSKNPTRRRSKRSRKLLQHHHQYNEKGIGKKLNYDNKLSKIESWAEPEPVSSSISDTTTEEDVAFCLMMLSRDKWDSRELPNKRKLDEEVEEQEEEEEEQEAEKYSMDETEESEEFKSCKNRSIGKFKCETCKKVFKSYQALGGHRASHKKVKVFTELKPENAGSVVAEKKLHECPYCFRVFSSGQALGGHKRSHVTGVQKSRPVISFTKLGDNLSLIDLNLPAPVEDDDDDDEISQIELSAVSDAEFVNPIRR